MNTNYTIPAFAEPITSLPDTPTCAAAELKRRFQAPADEVREAHNALAEAHEALDEKVEGIVSETFVGAIHESMFDQALADKLNGKAEQTALASEAETRESADAALQIQVDTKCEVVWGTYTGDDTAERVIELGFTPRAVLTMHSTGCTANPAQGHYYGGLALTDCPVAHGNMNIVSIVENGFRVYGSGSASNYSNQKYCYLAFR